METVNNDMQKIELPRYGFSEQQFNSYTAYTIKENEIREGLLVEKVICEVYSRDSADQIMAALEEGEIYLSSNYEVKR